MISNKNSQSNKPYTSMRYSVIVRIAGKNLFSKKLRTILTVLGVVIGVGAIVFLVSFGVGLQRLVENQVVGSRSIKTIDVDSIKARSLKFNSETIKTISGIANVEKVGKVYILAGKVKANKSESSSVIYGVDQNYFDLSTFNKIVGDMDIKNRQLAIVSNSFLESQGIKDYKSAINQSITIAFDTEAESDKITEVSINAFIGGVIESDGGSEIFISSEVVEDKGLNIATQLKVLANNQDSVPKIRNEIENRGFNTSSPIDTISEIDKIFQILQNVLIGFGGIGLVIAILGMFNTLTITLLERTREIGLMVTMGAQQKDIRRLFTIEALILSLIGGILGIIIAFLSGKIADLFLNAYARSNGVTDKLTAFYIAPSLVLISLLITIIIGLIVVYLPARRASRINPLDAMRE